MSFTLDSIDSDLAERALHGAWAHPLALLLTAATTRLFFDHPVVMGDFTLAVLLQGFWCLYFIRQLQRSSKDIVNSMRNRLVAVILFCGGVWGALAAYACATYGYHNPNTLLLLLYHSAIACSGISLLAHDLKLIRVYLVLMFLPPMLLHALFPDGPRWGPLFAFLLYLVFLAGHGKRTYLQYRKLLSQNQELARAVQHDHLTGLPNRLAMHAALDRELQRAHTEVRPLALPYVDLDGFKAINDRFSHRGGDFFLCDLAHRLKAVLDTSVSRLGGDEFTVLLTQNVTESAAITAAALLQVIQQPVSIEGEPCSAGASVGIAVFPDDAANADDLVRAADRAMCAAKRSGRNRVVTASSLALPSQI